MDIEKLLLTIEGPFAIGLAAGLLVGLLIRKPKLGCLILLAVPVAMICFISWWQGENPENLRSTSGLDFFFGALWPSLGAIAGYYAGRWFRSFVDNRG
ncbi:hypothetical protein [Qipengyuania sp. JC766]|uniref:hypothetical protein n=1 Tax=Qipengyuania sp. JC766 TaxID=3232139 RepID=UPI0034587325